MAEEEQAIPVEVEHVQEVTIEPAEEVPCEPQPQEEECVPDLTRAEQA